MMRVTLDIKCKNGQVTIRPKIYCKGKSTKLEDNVDELMTAMYATGLVNNITKASAALKEGVTDKVKYLESFQVSNTMRGLVKDHDLDFNEIYRDVGDPFISK